jgi:predicted O-linked N-acetylglucosamine transferase (SPINDLY family)
MNRKQRRAQEKSGAGPSQRTPSPRQTLFAEAVRQHQAGHLAEADSLYRQVLAVEPTHADSLYLRGMIAAQVGRHDVAVEMLTMAIKANRRAAPFHFSLGSSFSALGRLEEAAAAFRQGLALKADDAEAHAALGIALQSLGRPEEAAQSFRAALALNPRRAETHNNLGVALKSQGKRDEAIAAFRMALSLNPQDAPTYFNLGNVLHDQLRLDDAVTAFREALDVDPRYAEAHNNLAIALKDAWRLDEAALSYRAALDLNPNRAEAHSAYLAFLHYRPNSDDEHILAEARRFGATFESVPPVARRPIGTDPARRLRIGYVSGDFRHHPVGSFLAPVLDNHDRTAVEIFCYSNNSRTDVMTERLRDRCDHWRSIAGMADEAATDLIVSDGIDILVDLAGHTALNRLPLFARKPAPLQVTWLGYWGTTGLAAMDYLLSDAVTLPSSEERFYSERILRLPGNRFCYAPPDDAPEPAGDIPMRRNGHVTFGSFNNPDKLTPEVIRLWAAVLQAVPNARLLLKWVTLADESVCRRLREAFEGAGIAAERLILRGKSPHAAMLAEYGDVDIALDPFPFSGGLTSCEALWMGVPVVTLPEARAPSRQTLGFLQALDLAEWAATCPADYVKIAAALAADGERLGALRETLRRRMKDSSLCDGPGFTRGLEAILREIWRQWCSGSALSVCLDTDKERP